eukprot:jgi/Tetstr1/437202/TSEL_002772.t1
MASGGRQLHLVDWRTLATCRPVDDVRAAAYSWRSGRATRAHNTAANTRRAVLVKRRHAQVAAMSDNAGGDKAAAALAGKQVALEAALSAGRDLPQDPQLVEDLRQHIKGKLFGQEADPVCKWFFEWYQSDIEAKQQFVAQFLPEVASLFLLRPPTAPALPGLNALMVEVYE